MIKIFNANDTDFSSNGEIVINPIKCIEIHKKSLNGWYLDVEISIKYAQYIEQDKLCVVQTKSKLKPQAFRIANIEKTTKRIKFIAKHVMFDSENYLLLDVRPENQNAQSALSYINERTDNNSPFNVFSNVENINTAYFVRKNLLEAWAIIEERWNGIFDADNWDIYFLNKIGNDNGETVSYKNNLQNLVIYEDWSNVCTKIYPVGYDGLMLPEKYIEADIQYEKPYTKKVEFSTDLNEEDITEENLISELRKKANQYLNENKYPKFSYEITSNIQQNLEIGDTIHLKHPLVDMLGEVLEYEYDIISKKVKKIIFGNYTRDVKMKFDNLKQSIEDVENNLSMQQELLMREQTDLINSLNKKGYVYIDENEILILDAIPKEQAKNVWRWDLGGLGFSSNGYEGPFSTAITMDGKINANFIATGVLNANLITTGTLKSRNYKENTSGTSINLENGTIDTANFKIDSMGNIVATNANVTGKITATEGNISGFKLSNNNLLANIKNPYIFTEEDRQKLTNYLTGQGTLTDNEKEIYDANGDGVLSSTDVVIMTKIINGTEPSSGTLEIDTSSTYRSIILRSSNGDILTSMGMRSVRTPTIVADNIYSEETLSAKEIHLDVDYPSLSGTIGIISSGTNGTLYLGTDSSYEECTTAVRGNTVRLYAHAGGGVYLGYSGSTAVTSDEKLKNIFEIDDRYVEFFKNLKPITYIYKERGHRNHIGFGARQVEESLTKAGLTTEEFAGILKDANVTLSADEMGSKEDVHFDELYSLRYEEFVALNTLMIQKILEKLEAMK